MNKLLIFLVFGIFLISLASSESIGTFKQGDDVDLYQTCNNCTYCNLTAIKYPNSTNIANDVIMQKTNNYYNYTLINNFTRTIGDYKYCYDCGNGYTKDTGCIDFTIGSKLDTGEALLYILFIFINIIILGILMFFIAIMPGENTKDNRGVVIGIVNLKYLRVVLIGMFYGGVIVLLNFLLGISNNFQILSMFSGMIGFAFKALLSMSWIFSLIMCIWIVYMLIQDSNFKKHISKITRSPF